MFTHGFNYLNIDYKNEISYYVNNLSEYDDHDSMKHKLTQMPNHIPAYWHTLFSSRRNETSLNINVAFHNIHDSVSIHIIDMDDA